MKKPTIEQIRAIDSENNAVITACPGSGKTFTIIEKIKRHSKNLKSYEGIVAISYTNKAADEIMLRLKGENRKTFFIGTIDSFCLREIIFPFSKFLIKKNIDEFQVVDVPNDSKVKDFNYHILNLRKGIIHLNDIADISYLILKEVQECLNYLKAKYKMIFVDEYQDCREIQHLIWKFLSQEGIKLIVVGDIDQSIYSSFTDSNPKFLKELMENDNFESFELTLNHRSHKSIVDYSMRFKEKEYIAIDQIDKRVTKVNISGSEKQLVESIEKNILKIKNMYNVKKMSDIAIFCRSNDRVSKVCQFLTIPCKDHSLRAFHEENDFNRFCSLLLIRFFQFKTKEVTKMEFLEEMVSSREDEALYKNTKMKVNTLFSKKAEELHLELNLICTLFSEIKNRQVSNQNRNELNRVLREEKLLSTFKSAGEGEIQVMTYHKSKGLEFDVVFLMDNYQYILPFEFDGKYDSLEADENLHYVGLTRGKEAAYILIGTERYRSRSSDYVSARESIFLSRHELALLRNHEVWN